MNHLAVVTLRWSVSSHIAVLSVSWGRISSPRSFYKCPFPYLSLILEKKSTSTHMQGLGRYLMYSSLFEGILLRIRNAAFSPQELQSAARVWEELKNLIKWAALPAPAQRHITCRRVLQGQQLAPSCTAWAPAALALPLPLMWRELSGFS